MPSPLLLVTGATGLVGSHVCERARALGWQVRALVRPDSDASFLGSLNIELFTADLNVSSTLPPVVAGVTHLVHCAAQVNDWGPVADFMRVNVDGLAHLLDAFQKAGTKPHAVHLSSLGVYPVRDYHDADESTPLNAAGIDGYTRSKVAAEGLLQERVAAGDVTAVILRPGFLYGPRDRTVVPRLLERLRKGTFAYLGDGQKLVSNTYVGNLVEAVLLALDRPDLSGEAFHITDGRVVSKREFVEGVCRVAGLEPPRKHVPLAVARITAGVLEPIWRALGKSVAPPVSQAGIKFMAYNLGFSIAKARTRLGYAPTIDFQQAIARSLS